MNTPENTIEYELLENGSVVTPVDNIATTNAGSTLNIETGEITQADNASDSFSVRAKCTAGGNDYYSEAIPFLVINHTYPTINIDGRDFIFKEGDWLYTRNLSSFSAEIQGTEWDIEGGNGLATKINETDVNVTLHVPILTTAVNIATLRLTLTFNTCRVIGQKSITLQLFTNVVDMGLPSGTLWATTNIDVTQPNGFAASPFQYDCSFFSWGNVDGHNPGGGSFSPWSWGGRNSAEPWYEGQVYGDTPGSTLIGNITPSFDAAHVNCGAPWRIPTNTEVYELFNNIDYVQADGITVITGQNRCITINGTNGFYLKSKINGNLLFFPVCGNGNGTSLVNVGSQGFYLKNAYTDDRQVPYLWFLSDGRVYTNWNNERHFGAVIRPVM